MVRLVAFALVATLVCSLQTGHAQRLPPTPVVATPAESPADAPGPGGETSYTNIYEYLSSDPEFSSLMQLIDATPSQADLLRVLDSQCGGINSTSITFLAPTNDGIRRSLANTKPPTTVNEFVKNSNLVLQVLMYHILPTPLPPKAFGNGNSFNSILTNANGLFVSIAVQAPPGGAITLVGSTNSATIIDSGVSTCEANPSVVYALDGLLLPGTVASSTSAGVQSTPGSSSASGSASGSR